MKAPRAPGFSKSNYTGPRPTVNRGAIGGGLHTDVVITRMAGLAFKHDPATNAKAIVIACNLIISRSYHTRILIVLLLLGLVVAYRVAAAWTAAIFALLMRLSAQNCLASSSAHVRFFLVGIR